VIEAQASRELYSRAFGIPFKEENGGYLHTESLKGANIFALWPLSQAAQSCFGTDSWPRDVPVPPSLDSLAPADGHSNVGSGDSSDPSRI
jgi:hypothetical protein